MDQYINFTMDLVLKDTDYLMIRKNKCWIRDSPKIVNIFKDGKKYGSRAWSSMIVKRLEESII